MIYYTADTHFHYAPLLESRGFASTGEMDETLIRNWNSVVTDDDTVYLVGDIGYNGGHVPCRTLARLNGHKHLIRGNHDTAFDDAPLLYRYFESVTDFLEIEDDGTHILLSHYPMLYHRRGYMIHGHLHNSGGHFYEILQTLPKVLNAGVDVNGMKPVTLQELIENNRIFYSTPPAEVPHKPRGSKGFLPAVPDFRPLPEKYPPHPKHLFLTGRKQVGKSTTLRKLLEGRDAQTGGFLTVRLKTPDGASIHMIRPGETEFMPENQLFYKHKGQMFIEPDRFDRLGGAILAQSRDADLILMDELGPAESESAGFQQAVRECLDGDIPVYGVLQIGESAFLDEIKARSDVCVITVTEENRVQLAEKLLNAGW